MNLNNLLNSETGQQLVKTYHAEQQQKRTDLFTELDTIKDQRNNELPALNRTLEQAAADCIEAQSKLEAAKIRERTADSKVRQAKGVYSSRIARIEKELTATAPESINTFCDELREEIRDLQNTGITKTLDKSNARSITLRLESMREAVNKAQALKLQAVTDIGSRLKRLRDGLPAITMQ